MATLNMTPLLRRLLLCLLVLALPAQGLAAATMALCGMAPVPPKLSQHGSHAPAHPAGPVSAVPDCHEHDVQAAPAEHACSACSVCGLVGALLDTVPELPVLSLGDVVGAAPLVPLTAFVGNGLDRPPRLQG
jgi:hypothetical protein